MKDTLNLVLYQIHNVKEFYILDRDKLPGDSGELSAVHVWWRDYTAS